MSQINISDSPYPAKGNTPMITSSPPRFNQAMSPPSSPPPPQYIYMPASASNTALPASSSNPQMFSVGNTVIGGSGSQPLVQLAVIVIPPKAENPVGEGDEALARGKGRENTKIKKEEECMRNPCYPFGISMDKGAKIWACVNLTAAVVDVLFTFVHLLYVYHVIRFTEGYSNSFQVFHAMECPSTLKVDITLSYVGSIFNVMAACLFIYATYFVKDNNFRHRLCLLFNHIIFVPIIFCLPRFVIGFYGENQAGKNGTSCVLQFDGHAETNFWVLNVCVMIGFIIWFLYGFWVSDAFIRWLIISSEGNKEKQEKGSGEGVDDEDNDI